MGDPTRVERAELSSGDQKPRRGRGQELDDPSIYIKKEGKPSSGNGGAEAERNGGQHDDK